MKILVILAGVWLSGAFLFTFFFGRQTAKRNAASKFALEIHRRAARAIWWSALIAVMITELFVRMNGGLQPSPLFWIHLSCAVPFFVSLMLIRFWLNGLKHPALHRQLAYLCLVSFIGTIITGTILLARL